MNAALPHTPTLSVKATPALPVDKMVIGMQAEEAAALLPRVFNLCRTAQSMAARAAFNLQIPETAPKDLADEIVREHVLRLCLRWPRMLGLPTVSLPPDWPTNPKVLRQALFGDHGCLPDTLFELVEFMSAGIGIGQVLQAIHATFEHGEACTPKLALSTPANVFEKVAQENSVATRHAHLQIMREIEAEFGRGPLWRVVAMGLDVQLCLEGALPNPVNVAQGRVVVPAARGLYAVTAKVNKGKVAEFQRTTPTDHLLAPNGTMQQALARTHRSESDPAAKLLIEILNPCIPVSLREVEHA